MKQLNINHIVWILMLVLIIVALATISRAETTLLVRAFSATERISLDGINLNDTFNVSKSWNPFEIRAAWIQPAQIELSYTYGSRRVFDGAGIFPLVFRDLEFSDEKPIGLSGSILTHTVDARLLTFTWIAPRVRWQYTDVSMTFCGETSDNEQVEVSDHWRKSFLALGASVGWRLRNIWVEGDGLVGVTGNHYQVTLQALYPWRQWSFGGGYRIEKSIIGPVEIRNQGPFIAAGVRF